MRIPDQKARVHPCYMAAKIEKFIIAYPKRFFNGFHVNRPGEDLPLAKTLSGAYQVALNR